MSRRRVILRADGNSEIGLGHIYRCIALAQMLGKNFDLLFVIQNPSEAALKTIQQDCPQVHILPETKDYLEEAKYITSEVMTSDDIVAIDGYNFNINYYKTIKNKAHKLIVIDDLADKDICAEVIINHGSTAVAEKYRNNKNNEFKELLCGFDYLLLRREFLEEAKKEKREIKKIDSVFICIGGADQNNITLKILSGAIHVEVIKRIVIVIGNAYRFRESLNKFIRTVKNKIIEVHENISARHMISLIKSCSIAISPASTTALEICCVKTPLITGYTIDNQFSILNELIVKDCCVSIGDFNKTIQKDISFILNMQKVSLANNMINKQTKCFAGHPNNNAIC